MTSSVRPSPRLPAPSCFPCDVSLLVGVDSVQSLTRAAEVTSVGYVTAPQKQAAEDIRTHVKASSQLSQQIFTLLSLIQNQNNYLNGVAEPRALNLGRVKGLLSVYRRRVEALLRELDTQRQRVVTSAQVMVNATSSPLVRDPEMYPKAQRGVLPW